MRDIIFEIFQAWRDNSLAVGQLGNYSGPNLKGGALSEVGKSVIPVRPLTAG